MNSLIRDDARAASMPGDSDSNIIIFSRSHQPVSIQTERSGVLEIEITSFGVIQQILINGTAVSGSGDSVAHIEFPYQLEPGENRFSVNVVTDEGKGETSFVMNLVEPSDSRKDSFQLIGITGVAALDNVASAKDDKQSGTKLSLVVVPRYEMSKGGSTLRFQGVLLRERFSDRDFSGNEISYTQVLAQWIKSRSSTGNLSGGVAYNDIRTNNDNPLLGEDESMTEAVIMGSLEQALSKALAWRIRGDFTLRDSREEVTSENDEADAREIGLEGGLKIKSSRMSGTAMVGYNVNDAKGDYVDSAAAEIDIKAKYSIGDFIPGLGYSYKEKTGKNKNAFGVKQKDKTSKVVAKVDYKWELIPDSLLSLKYQAKDQTSNVSTAEYSATEITLSLTIVF